ncbi:MAG: SoxR reducing system RseC family protein [Chitinispirillales bacterium]|jgi:positive regulator of sigma E activity|nr:SoxR reducing system RseC family protein [Chitinispirillales bacterium]
MQRISSRAGKILQVNRDKIKIELFSNELPQSCEVKGCNVCKSHSPKIERDYPKSNFCDEITVNDIVKIECLQINDGVAAAIVFLTPLLFSAVFYYVSTALGISLQSVLSIVFAVFGGIFGFVAVAIFDKIFRRLNPAKIFKE